MLYNGVLHLCCTTGCCKTWYCTAVCFTTVCCTRVCLQQRVAQRQTVSIHDTISLCKLQSLGKCHNEYMKKAVCFTTVCFTTVCFTTVCCTTVCCTTVCCTTVYCTTVCLQQRVVQRQTVSIHDTINFCKLQSLGKCHNEYMNKAACLAIILAYATEEETVYRKRKRSIWTKGG
jgi:hypothetical protein